MEHEDINNDELALGSVNNGVAKNTNLITRKLIKIHQMQKITLFGTAHILRKVPLLKSHPCPQIFGVCPVQGEFVAALLNCLQDVAISDARFICLNITSTT